MFRAFCSIQVYVPLSYFSIVSVMDQLSQPLRRVDSTVATKNLFFKSAFIEDFQIFDMSLRAFYARAFLTFMSFAESSTHEPRYLKSSFCSSTVPSLVTSGGCSVML